MKRYLVVMHVFIGATLFALPDIMDFESAQGSMDVMPDADAGVQKKITKKKSKSSDTGNGAESMQAPTQVVLSAPKKSAVSVLRDDFREDKSLQRKMDIAEKLVNDATDFFEEVGLARAARSFEKDERWTNGEFNINIFDEEGNCYLFGVELQNLWVNFKDVEKTRELRGLTALGTGFIEEMVEKGDAGGGWVSFDWNYATNYSYVRTVVYEGTKFILCAGMYPESPRFQIRQLVKAAVRFAIDKGADVVFRQINNPAGDFVRGDGYLWAYDMEANNLAHGRNLALVGQNQINWKDSSGRYRNKMMLELIKKQGSGWLEYEEDGIMKYAFVEAFTDPRTGKRYIIGGGYYPEIDNDTVIAFVKRASEYLKARGRTVAMRDFASYAGGFIKGPLRILALDLSGVVLADGANPIFIGQNLMNMRDSEGKYVIRDMIDMVKKQGRGWISYIENKGYRSVYAEYVETPDGKFIIASGYWPASKKFAVQTLTEKASIFLKTNPTVWSFHMFAGESEDFLRGDLFVEVYTLDGICLTYGLDMDRVWNDEKKVLDDKGYPIIDRVINMAKRGGGWVEYPSNKATRRVYTQLVTKPIEVKGVEKSGAEETSAMTKKDGAMRKDSEQKASKREQSFVVAVGYYE